MLIDTHCHLTSPGLVEHAEAVLGRARAAGVERVMLVAVDPADGRRALDLMSGRPDLFLIAGIHPHEAKSCTPAQFAALSSLLRGEGLADELRRRIVAVGETGLDFHYDFSPPARQEEVFRAHLVLAIELGLPVVIHSRESEPRVCDILAEYPTLAGRVVFHCFSGGVDATRRVLDLGAYCSFTGVVTFKKSASIQEAARYVPRDRMLIETDAPYLSPEPVRKIRPNEPALLVHTARFLADLRAEPYAEFATATTANAVRFFQLPEVR